MKNLIFILIFSLYLTTAKGQDCYAWFTYNTNITTNITYFTSYAIMADNDQITGYLWDFNDGITSNLQNPSHIFTEGTGYVCLTIITENSCNFVKCQYILMQSTPCVISSNYNIINPIAGLNNGSINANITGSKPPFTLIWSNDIISDSIGGLSSGSYYVTIIDNQSCQKIDTIKLYDIENVSLSGEVFAENNPLPEGKAILFKKQDAQLKAEKITSIEDGNYKFDYVTSGSYTIYAIPNFNYGINYYPFYFPTYIGDSIHWENSLFIDALAKNIIPTIQLVSNESINYGNASIEGTITYVNENSYESEIYNSNWFDINSIPGSIVNDAARNITILLTNENGEPLKYVLSDENGHFKFDKLDYGSYYIYAEKAGKITEPSKIKLTEPSPTSQNTIMFLDNTSVYYAIEDVNKNSDIINTYPNPFNNLLAISINYIRKMNLNISIISSLGKIVYEEQLNTSIGLNNYLIDTKNIDNGFYILKIVIDSEKILTKKLVK